MRADAPLIALLLAGCPHSDAPIATPVTENTASPTDPFAPTWHDPVQVEGIYVVDPAPGSRMLQAAWLLLPDGTAWIVSYEPDPSRYAYVDKRVVVNGRPFEPSRLVQSVGATHLEVDEMALAPGETPYDPPPTSLPAPPMIATVGELAARVHRWAMVPGTLTAIQGAPGSALRDGTWKLPDGTELPVVDIPDSHDWDLLVGQPATLLAGILPDPRGSGALRLDASTLCAGEAPRCGMVTP